MKRARLKATLAFATLTVLGCTFPFGGLARAAGPDPAAETQRLLIALNASDSRSVVQDPVSKAKAAQQRAQNARGAGDLQHATELDTLALTWAQVADDLRRAAAAEKQLADLQKTVMDLEQKAVRTQALIEQTIARKGRAEQNLANEADGSGVKKTPRVKGVLADPTPAVGKPKAGSSDGSRK